MIRADTVQSLDSCIVLQIVTCRAFETPQVVTLQNTAPLRLNSWIPFSCLYLARTSRLVAPPQQNLSKIPPPLQSRWMAIVRRGAASARRQPLKR